MYDAVSRKNVNDPKGSSSSEASIRDACANEDRCIGYYANELNTQFYSTGMDPGFCSASIPDRQKYPTFYQKGKVAIQQSNHGQVKVSNSFEPYINQDGAQWELVRENCEGAGSSAVNKQNNLLDNGQVNNSNDYRLSWTTPKGCVERCSRDPSCQFAVLRADGNNVLDGKVPCWLKGVTGEKNSNTLKCYPAPNNDWWTYKRP
jgi:hypothetical protein